MRAGVIQGLLELEWQIFLCFYFLSVQELFAFGWLVEFGLFWLLHVLPIFAIFDLSNFFDSYVKLVLK